MKNYYKILDISFKASTEEIKKAYRVKAIKYHPDKNNGSKDFDEKFKEVLEAYNTLKVEDDRMIYDLKWSELYGSFNEQKKDFETNSNFESSEQRNSENTSFKKKGFYYKSPDTYYSQSDRNTHKSEPKWPKFNHIDQENTKDLLFFKYPTNIGRIISGYSNIRNTEKAITGKEARNNILKGVLAGVLISLLIIFLANVNSVTWIFIWIIVPVGVGFIIGYSWNILSGKNKFVGVNGFALFECLDEYTKLTTNIEINFRDITHLSTSQTNNYYNYTYLKTNYDFVWLKNSKEIHSYSNTYDDKNGNPKKTRYEEYWFYKLAEKQWTIYLLDNLEIELEKKGFLVFSLIYDNKEGGFQFVEFIKMGIGYIEFSYENDTVRYEFDKIKSVYSKKGSLFFEHQNYKKFLFFKQTGNKSEIPLSNLCNKQFFFKALELLVGY